MIQDAERDTGPVLTWEGDPRITKVGRILRRARIDELPQLINVLQGDMSFVGPRPERPFFVDQFSDSIPDYRYRLQVKPGITGLAQIEGRYSTNPEDKLKYDLYYIRGFSLLLDLQIMLRTLKVAFTPDKASGLGRANGLAVEEGAPASDSVSSDCEDASYHS
jgi:lipopolysaccharide/colanic/teichoic acid biosynthesis glycosyltransferase